MKKSGLFIYFMAGLGLLLSRIALAQEPASMPPAGPVDREKFWDKVYIGGNFGLQFGTATFVNVSPQFGYRVTDRFIPGIGITYIYYSYKPPYQSRQETNIFGGSIFGKYFFTPNLFGHVEYEELNMEIYEYVSNQYRRLWVPSFYVGGGYRQMIGARGFLQLMVLYEVLQDRNSLYYRNNPIIRIGFGF